LKDRKDVRVNKLGSEARWSSTKFQGSRKGDIRCHNCGEVGHMARDCKNPRHTKRNMQLPETGVEGRPPDRVNLRIGSVNTIGSKNGAAKKCVSMRSDINNGKMLLLLVDTGADISFLKPDNLDKTKQYDPEVRVQVKSVSGSIIQTIGSVQAVMYEGSVRISFTFELVDKRIDLPCDGILEIDFLAHTGAKICYETGILTLGTGSAKIHKVLSPINAKGQSKEIRRLVLPRRAEIVVRLPVEGTTRTYEGLMEKQEIREGVYLAGAITKVQADYAITSIGNTTDEAVEIVESVLRVTEVEPGTPLGPPGDDNNWRHLDRPGEVLKRLQLEHLSEEESKEIEETCLDYQDKFHLPGEVLSSTTAVKHEIRLEPGTEPVNARPYRLPESQKQEVRRQIEELKRGGIITESSSAWNKQPVAYSSEKVRR